MRELLRTGAILLVIAALLTGCGGGSSSGPSLTPDDNNQGGPSQGNQADQTTEVRLGSTQGGTFQTGSIASNKTELQAGQGATLTVSLVDSNGGLVTESADILFNSSCISSGLADIEEALITNSTGTISTTYTARGCDGPDRITATTSIGGTTLSADVVVNTIPSPLGSITFVSAEPQLIGIKGSGAIEEQSVVTFQVTNSSGGPVQNQEVTFGLNNATGGITLSNDNDTSDSNGLVSTTVQSGTVASSVRVTASAVQNGIVSESQSSALAITTGLPDQDSFSISASTLNIEGLDYDGVTTEITIRAADRFNNPAPDGTAVTFQTEGAAIEGSCLTEGGACSVTLTSQNPRPTLDGRVTVLATALGEESFIDSNPSNGRFDGRPQENFGDLTEAFRDDNENDLRDSNEPFVDFNSNGLFDGINDTFEGVLCNSGCNPEGTTTVTLRQSIVIVLSGSSFNIDLTPSSLNLDNGPATISAVIYDVNGQVPPAGTTITAGTDLGSLSGVTSHTVLSTNANGPVEYTFSIKPEDNLDRNDSGTFTVTVTTPRGVISRNFVDLTQSATSGP